MATKHHLKIRIKNEDLKLLHDAHKKSELASETFSVFMRNRLRKISEFQIKDSVGGRR